MAAPYFIGLIGGQIGGVLFFLIKRMPVLLQQCAPPLYYCNNLNMYVELHAFVRARLAEHYGPKVADANAITTTFTSRMLQVVDATKAIPAHLLGNMWAQSWGNLCVCALPLPQ